MINIFIGYDKRMPGLYSVLSQSIIENSSVPISISPVCLSHYKNLFTREIDPKQSTQFSFSRFLVPYLSNYKGWSIFMDNDALCLADINELWKMRDDKYVIMCVKHDDYEIKEDVKFLGEKQTKYQKKNWSSVMLINNAKCKALTPDYVNSASGLQLHQFKWLESDDLIGSIPVEWNYLVGYYPVKQGVKLLHYTDGGPYFNEYKNCDFADQWIQGREAAIYIQES